jgi:vitamin K-dependent gamma-carboxylase
VTTARSFLARLRSRAFAPIDNATLIFFRIAFGVLMLCEVYRYFIHGWIASDWIEPRFLFKYYGFSWVHPWPGNGMYIHWAMLGMLAVFIAFGLMYRLSAALFFLGFTYSFLLDQVTYLNHFYFICLLSFLLIFMPADRALSVHVWLQPALRTQTAPAWTLWLLRFQLAVVYFYAGLAKISPDWLHGEPMRTWIAQRSQSPIFALLNQQEWVAYLSSYGGLLLDLLIAPALLWRRTRAVAFCIAVLFHLANACLFPIGIFPWLSIAATSIFLSPSWPRKFLLFPGAVSPAIKSEPPPTQRRQVAILSLAGVYMAIQFLVPLRQFLYPGPADWTYEGHRFSWRMMLFDRRAHAQFFVTDPNIGNTVEINAHDFVSSKQLGNMSSRSDMILQFAHYLAATLPRAGPAPLQVRARVSFSLNGRAPELLVDPNVDLAAEKRTLLPARWILPMTAALPKRPRPGADAMKGPVGENDAGRQ